ncbi:MAG: MFS transporter [Sphingomonas phyllosphaerae]
MAEPLAGAHAASGEARIVRTVTMRLLPLLILLYTVAYVDRSVVGFAKLQLAADIGLGDTAYGFGAGLFFIGYFLFELPSNILLTRVGARRWFARILVSWGVVTVLMATIRTPLAFYVLRFLLGAAEAGLYPGIVFYLTRWYPQRHLGRILGLFLMAQPFALIMTGPLSAWLLGLDGALGLRGWQWLFVVSGVPAVLLALPTLVLLPDDLAAARWLSNGDRRWLAAALAEETPPPHAAAAGEWRGVFRDGRVLRLALALLPFPLAVYGVTLWLPTLLAAGGRALPVAGLLFAVPYVFGAIALWVVPRRSDRAGQRHGYVIGNALLAALGLAGSAALPGTLFPLAALCLAVFGLYASQSVFWTLPSAMLTGTAAAAGIAIINSVGNLGGYLGPFLMGVIKEQTGRTTDGLYVLAGSLLLTIWIMAGERRRAGGDRAP